jgi:hypothetical protein
MRKSCDHNSSQLKSPSRRLLSCQYSSSSPKVRVSLIFKGHCQFLLKIYSSSLHIACCACPYHHELSRRDSLFLTSKNLCFDNILPRPDFHPRYTSVSELKTNTNPKSDRQLKSAMKRWASEAEEELSDRYESCRSTICCANIVLLETAFLIY